MTEAAVEWKTGDPFDPDLTPVVGYEDGPEGPTSVYADGTRIFWPIGRDPVEFPPESDDPVEG